MYGKGSNEVEGEMMYLAVLLLLPFLASHTCTEDNSIQDLTAAFAAIAAVNFTQRT